MKSEKQLDSDQKLSVGTKMAELERAKANRFSEDKRQRLLNKGMALIYGGNARAKAQANRR